MLSCFLLKRGTRVIEIWIAYRKGDHPGRPKEGGGGGEGPHVN